MSSTIDLHLHSSVSDGKYSPAELVRKAAGMGMKVISLTDHDNVDGIPEALDAAAEFPGFTLIPGVELSTDVASGEVHLLGYFIDHTHPGLLAALSKMRDSRHTRAEKMLEKLAALGLPLEWSRVQELAGEGTIGRPHIAQAMLEKGYISTFKEAFDKYLAWGGPAYVERDKMTPQEAIALVTESGGLSVLAHPTTTSHPETLVPELKAAGLVGLEAYYKDYNDSEIKTLVSLAGKHGLLATGGTDYHGLDESTETPIGGAPVPPEAVEKLLKLAEGRKKGRAAPRGGALGH